MRQRSSHNWKSKPGTWDALNTEYIDFEGDYPVIGTDNFDFNSVINCNDYKNVTPGCLVSMFVDDYILERYWNHPHNYLTRFRVASLLMSPDFSLLIGMPTPCQMFQVYKNRLVGHVWQSQGLNVVPSVSWSDRDSFEYAFNGIRYGSVVAVSNIGVSTPEHNVYFQAGYTEMLERINPTKVIFMANQKFRQQYQSERVIFIDSFFTRRKKQWAEEEVKN